MFPEIYFATKLQSFFYNFVPEFQNSFSNHNIINIPMKKIGTTFLALSVALFFSCGGHNHHNHEEAHGHEADHEHNIESAHSHSDSEHSEKKNSHEGHADEIIFSKHQAEEAGVKIETATPAKFRTSLQVSGQIISGQGDEQTVVATSAGIVRFANASIAEGAAVSAGQTIAFVSSKNIQDGDPSEKAKAAYEAAKSDYNRAKELAKEQIVSQKDLAQLKMQYETARIAYEAQGKHATASGVAVSSSLSGYIKNRLVSQGEYVSVGQPIVTVTKNRRLQLRADVPMENINLLSQISGANFQMAGSKNVYSTEALHGRVLSYARSVSDGSAFLPITLEFDNVGDLVSGAFAMVWLQGKEREGVLSLPKEALTESQGVKYVYVQVESDAYVRREVTTGSTDGIRIEILHGLRPGEKVVTKGAYQIKLASLSTAIPHGHSH